MSDYLTPAEARARFGELRHYSTATHKHFAEPTGGEWRPELGPGMTLTGYRLHQPLLTPHLRPPYRPRT